ncbi:MAG: hypothetical protein GX242_03055 [Clostridiales bacterium]|nr:hypothetical protein [Clostridiales bacterium]
MKRLTTFALLIVAIALSVTLLTACANDSDALSVVSYEIEPSNYFVGDAFDTSKVSIAAKMSDDTTKKVTNNLFFSGHDKESLKLDDENKFTTPGTYKVNVFFLVDDNREDNRFFLGEWELVVKAKK